MMLRDTVLLLTIAIGLYAARTGAAQERAEAERRALGAIEELGGWIVRDEQQPGRPVVRVTFPPDVERAKLSDPQLREAYLRDSARFAAEWLNDLKALKDLKDLEELDLGGFPINDTGLKELRDFPKLRDLTIVGTMHYFTEPGLAALGAMPSLQKLKLEGVTDAGLKEVGALRNLRELSFGGGVGPVEVTDAGLRHLRGLEQLEALDFFTRGVTGAGLKELVALKNLRRLRLRWPIHLTDDGLKPLAALNNLRELDLSFEDPMGFTGEGLEGFKNLEALTYRPPILTDFNLPPFRELKNLRRLVMAAEAPFANLTAARLGEIRHLENLRELDLTGVPGPVVEEVIEDLKALKHLEKVALSLPTEDGDACLRKLRGLSGLERLNLQGNQVSAGGLAELKEHKNLRALALDVEVTDAHLKALHGLKNLRVLSLGGPSNAIITDAGLKELTDLANLEVLEVNLDGNQLTDEGLKELGELTNLRELRLLSRKITGIGFKELKGLKNLRELYLATPVTDAGLREIKDLKGLRSLSLSVTRVTGAGFISELKDLKELKNLEVLDLGGNERIKAEDIVQLQKALPKVRIRY